MAFASFPPSEMRPTALALNILLLQRSSAVKSPLFGRTFLTASNLLFHNIRLAHAMSADEARAGIIRA
jgi:hypothetical protein